MSLKLNDVTVSRGIGPVISNVSLEIKPGEVVTLVGPNGAGKTSLLESISGVIGVSGGDIELDGESITKLSRRKRARAGISHVEQGRMIFPSLTVKENLQLTARTQADMDEALALFPELEKRINSQTILLSGGEQQMVVLARAFAAKPKFLLLDEMSLGLAPVVFLRLIPIIQKIAETGVGVLLVEQFAHLALKIASDSMVITSGRVSYHGPAQALLDDESKLRQAYLG
ncbi:ABC transporter ATP-binding protein [Aurantimicrobium minutum]|uniref:ABC transporter ATP-binding protein n=1 Tax=Aurantimicrobium minutum TaxID=708131 RepID=UPI0024754EB0|nr:ABC transporter ATP-binding protein [Aurantimicrobium minutum]MDH6536122.1 branched-chain amino acid transport system ATP-binding protein [Aurantimicrobium minutum]